MIKDYPTEYVEEKRTKNVLLIEVEEIHKKKSLMLAEIRRKGFQVLPYSYMYETR